MDKILITGVEGFTGKYLREYLLDQDYDVIGTSYDTSDDSRVITMDITDVDSVRECLLKVQPDYIIHLAALSFIAHDNERAFYDVNLFGTLNLLNTITEIDLPIKKVVLASSANIYGNKSQYALIHESCPPGPVNHYAMSKLAMEHMSMQFSHHIPIVITRPFNYTGPGQDPKFLIPKIVQHVKDKKENIELGNIDIYRDFSDVRDIINYYAKLMFNEEALGIFNLCSGTVYSVRDIISMVQVIADYKIKIQVNPMFVRDNDIKKLVGDNSKLINTIHVMPQYALEQTLSDMYYAC
jgi:nucleoside-diphosphate-sugar epimerase